MKKHFRTSVLLALWTILAVISVTACGGGSSAASKSTWMAVSDGYSGGSAENGAYAAAEAVAETTAAALPAAGTWEEAEEPVDAGSSYDGVLSDSASMMSAGQESSVNTGRKLIRTINLNVETTEFDTLLENLRQAIEADGGYIERSDVSGSSISASSGRRYAYLTARVPADKLDAFLSKVAEQSNIVYRSESVEDVTLQYTDIESRKKSLTIEQERLWDLLEKADSLESVIALEQRLSEIRYELEKFESQLRTYDNQVDYSTVYIDINEVTIFTPTAPDSVATRIQKGFTRNLRNVGNGFVDFFVWLISSLPTLAVWAVIIAVIVLIIRYLVRRFRRGKGGRPPKAAKAGKPSAAPAGKQGQAQKPDVPVQTQNVPNQTQEPNVPPSGQEDKQSQI